MLSLLKVEFDYESTNQEELTIKEDQLVYLLENDDKEWFKVKLKSSNPEDAALIGLVPASYLTSPTIIRQVQTLYAYIPTRNEEGELENEEELEVDEGELLDLFEDEGDWVLVGKSNGKGVGFVPSSYVETVGEEPIADPEEIYQEAVIPTPIPYVEPSERVAATKPVVKVGEVKTWSVSEVDKKKKKKKGTLGIGNGAVFFASESDKTPVQQYSLSTLSEITTEKSKHLHLTFPAGESHFVISSKDTFEEILTKLNQDKDLATSQSESSRTITPLSISTPRTVNFPAPPSSSSFSAPSSLSSRAIPPPLADRPYIPPPPPVRTASYTSASPSTSTSNQNQLPNSSTADGDSTALYDFSPQGEDELSIREGDRLVFIVGGSDDPDWVKVRKVGSLEEGVVPASYVERDERSDSSKPNGRGRQQQPTSEDEEEERLAASDALTLKAQLQADAKASKVAAERLQERENQARKSRLSIAPPVAPIPVPTRVDVERDGRDTSGRRDTGKERSSREAPKKPATHRVRTWKDRTGQFKVEAEFLGLNGNKIRLHKLNGVIIEVPMEKMSSEDTAYLKRVTARSSSVDDDTPLAQIANQEDRRNERHKRGEAAANAANSNSNSGNGNGNTNSSSSTSDGRTRKSSRSIPPSTKNKPTDWFDFFLNAGCDMHACTRYGNNFEKERIEENLIVDIGASTLRTLGLREGDIIRVLKYIKLKYEPPPTPEKSDRDARLAIDASISKSMNSIPTPTPPAPNLFSGPDGALKTTRRGRPNRANSNVNAVDAASLASAGSELARKNSPANGLGLTNTIAARVASPPATSNSLSDSIPKAPTTTTTTTSGGFDDDAWTVKGTSKVSPAVPSTSLAELNISPPPAITPLQPPQRAGSAGPASTLSYNDGLLAQLGIGARPPSAPVGQVSSQFTPQQQQQLLQQQQMQQMQQQQQQQQTYSQAPASFGPRPPVAPVQANQGLLAPLIPTVTGMPGGYRSPYSQIPMMPQATGFGLPQQQVPMMTGYSGMQSPQMMPGMGIQQQQQPMAMNQQFTGMPNRNGSPFANPIQPSFLQSQPTGIPNFLQTQPTGYQQPQQYPQQQQQQLQPNFAPQPTPLVQFNPLPPQQSSAPPASTTSAQFTPSNVFASMKGTQDATKYDALRPQPTGFQSQMGMIQPQPTGFGMPMNLQQQPQQSSIFPQQSGIYGQPLQQQQQQQPNGYPQQRQY